MPWGVWPEDIGLALIGRIAPHPRLLAMEEIGQDRGVMDVKGGRHWPYGWQCHGVADLGRRRGVDNGGVHDRALAHLDAPGLPVAVDLLEELLAGMMLLEERAELQDGGLIRHRLLAEIYADEPAHGDRLVQGLLGPRIGEIEPLLEESDPQHMLEPHLSWPFSPLG